MPHSNISSSQDVLRSLQEQKFALDQSAIIAQTDAFGRITYVNQKLCEISGYDYDELLGKNFSIFRSSVQTKEFFQEMWETISAGKIWRGDLCNCGKFGKLFWVSTTIVPFVDDNGYPHQYLSIHQDITDLKKAQKKIEDQQLQMIASSRLSAIGEMAATVAHEINNPLGVILGRVEMIKSLMLRENFEIAQFARIIESIEVAALRIEKNVNSMKNLSHEGHDEPLYSVRICSLINDVIDLFYEKFRMNGIEFSMNECDSNICLECRSHEIMQVLVNLVNNAIDAVINLKTKWIRIDVEIKNSDLEISVVDSGFGISSHIVDKIFLPFFSTKRVQYGTGLGLSISKSLIQRHHGQLEYDCSSPYTRFIITVPFNQS